MSGTAHLKVNGTVIADVSRKNVSATPRAGEILGLFLKSWFVSGVAYANISMANWKACLPRNASLVAKRTDFM